MEKLIPGTETLHPNKPTEESQKAPHVSPENVNEEEEIKSRKRSVAWDHFKVIEGCPPGKEKAICNFCGTKVSCSMRSSGTSSMIGHLKRHCPRSPLFIRLDKKQKTLNFSNLSKEDREKMGTTHNIQVHTFNQERLKKKVAMMCIKDNISFSIVQHEGFVELMNEAQPLFKMPSRWMVARDCINIYKEEALKLKECISSQRLSLTTDTLTSVQNTNYMCLTAHWINDDWKLCKRILSFCQVGSHKGVAIGKLVDALIKKWGIERIFTITVDNASSNDIAISHLKKFLRGREAILDNKYMHLRCCAHILNLIVKDGLKDQHEAISRIRNAVRYVRSSPARLAKFKVCIEKEKIKCGKMVCLDVDTRWNSTYAMLEVAIIYESAFERMYVEDYCYETFFKNNEDCAGGDGNINKKKKRQLVEGHPQFHDFTNVKCLVQFLKIFYEVTIKISGSKYSTSNLFFIELVKIQEAIMELTLSDDTMIAMAMRMKEKYDKYWDNMDNTNFLLYVSVVLDPRYKMHYINFCFSNLYGSESSKCSLMCERILKTLREMFDHYKNEHGLESSSTISPNIGTSKNADFRRYMKEQVQGGMGKSEIDTYLMDGIEMEDRKFDL